MQRSSEIRIAKERGRAKQSAEESGIVRIRKGGQLPVSSRRTSSVEHVEPHLRAGADYINICVEKIIMWLTMMKSDPR